MEVRESDHINYRTHDGSNWTAWRDGPTGFLHAPKGDRSRAHRDTIINYLTLEHLDAIKWTARWRENEFYHYPADQPERGHADKTIIYQGWDVTTPIEIWQAYWDDERKLFVHTKMFPKAEN